MASLAWCAVFVWCIVMFGADVCLCEQHPLPTGPQLAWSESELGVIIHFNIATSAGTQGCNKNNLPPTSLFHPTELDTDQWMKAASDFGAKHAVYVAKHNCGFCTWKTNVAFPAFDFVYNYSVQHSGWKGDVVQDFMASAQKYDIRPGFYYSLGLNIFLDVADGVPMNGTLLPGQVRVTQAQYEQIVLAQLQELWGNYGPLAEIWFDGGIDSYIATPVSNLLKKLQPGAVGFNGLGVSVNPVRWIGTESGEAPDPTWSTGGMEGGGSPNATHWNPAECDTTLQLGDNWFYSAEAGLRNMTELAAVYHATVGRNSNLLLDMAPMKNGKLPEDAVAMYAEFGKWIRECYGQAVEQTHGAGYLFKLLVPQGIDVDRVVVREDQQFGQRVHQYHILVNGDKVMQQESIGNKAILLFPSVVPPGSLVELIITKAYATPVIRSFGLYKPCPY